MPLAWHNLYTQLRVVMKLILILLLLLLTGSPAWAQTRAEQVARMQQVARTQQMSRGPQMYRGPQLARGQQTAGHCLDYIDKINSQGMMRQFIVHVPANYNRSKPVPLVLILHGGGLSGQIMIYITGFNACADKNGFIVVYPDAVGHIWNDEQLAGRVDDVAFINDVINRVGSTYNIDQRKIYAAGYSNGGYLAERVACESNRIAAIAIVGSSLKHTTAGACNDCNRRIPIMYFIGTEDPLVPSTDSEHKAELGKLGDIVGLSGLGELSAHVAAIRGVVTSEEAVNFWVNHNNSPPSPYSCLEPDRDPRDGTKVTRYSYGSYGNEVVYYRIHGGGHTWPGALYGGPCDIMGRTTQDINASELMTQFFLRH